MTFEGDYETYESIRASVEEDNLVRDTLCPAWPHCPPRHCDPQNFDHDGGPTEMEWASDAEYLDDPIADAAGYLTCGCHGSQRDHTCGPQD